MASVEHTLSLVRLNNITNTVDTKFSKYVNKPTIALYLRPVGWLYYPVIEFYRDKGIRGIYIESSLDNNISHEIENLGIIKISLENIVTCMLSAFINRTIDEIFREIKETIKLWCLEITQKECNIPKTSINIDYFGICLLSEKDDRQLITKEDVFNEYFIRTNFENRLPILKSNLSSSDNSWFSYCIIQ